MAIVAYPRIPNQKPPIGVQIQRGHPMYEGLRGAWILNEGAGLLTKNAAIPRSDGTLTGTPTWTSGRYGSALSFNGTSHYVTCALTTSLDVDNVFTIFAWVFPTSVTGDRAILADLASGGNNGQFHLIFRGSDIAAGWGNGSTIAEFTSDGAIVTINAWHCVAVTRDAAGVVSLFFNGQSVPGTFTTGNGGIAVYAANQGTAIGRYGAFSGGYFAGRIECVYIWKRVLLISELQCLYANPYEMFASPSRRVAGAGVAPPAANSSYYRSRARAVARTR